MEAAIGMKLLTSHSRMPTTIKTKTIWIIGMISLSIVFGDKPEKVAPRYSPLGIADLNSRPGALCL
jgi:hypothetical protein